jgi:hypothetical protein
VAGPLPSAAGAFTSLRVTRSHMGLSGVGFQDKMSPTLTVKSPGPGNVTGRFCTAHSFATAKGHLGWSPHIPLRSQSIQTLSKAPGGAPASTLTRTFIVV